MAKETPQAKIRNRLTPFWNIVTMVRLYSETKDPKILDIIIKEANVAESNKEDILKLLKDTENEDIR